MTSALRVIPILDCSAPFPTDRSRRFRSGFVDNTVMLDLVVRNRWMAARQLCPSCCKMWPNDQGNAHSRSDPSKIKRSDDCSRCWERKTLDLAARSDKIDAEWQATWGMSDAPIFDDTEKLPHPGWGRCCAVDLSNLRHDFSRNQITGSRGSFGKD